MLRDTRRKSRSWRCRTARLDVLTSLLGVVVKAGRNTWGAVARCRVLETPSSALCRACEERTAQRARAYRLAPTRSHQKQRLLRRIARRRAPFPRVHPGTLAPSGRKDAKIRRLSAGR